MIGTPAERFSNPRTTFTDSRCPHGSGACARYAEAPSSIRVTSAGAPTRIGGPQ